MLLEINQLSAFYEAPDNLALAEVSLEVAPREIVALLGSNGAGKSTILKAIFQEVRIKEGEILFEGASITRETPSKLIAKGISFVPEGRRLFGSLTVEENLEMGAFILKDQRKLQENKANIFQLFPVLADRRRILAKRLSGGQQQMLAIGRALMVNPKFILIDEPSLGLAPQVVEQIFDLFQVISELGAAVLLVEQNVRKALEVAHRVYMLHLGKVAFCGTPKDLLAGENLEILFLGG